MSVGKNDHGSYSIFMSLKDFLCQFRDYQICYINPDYRFSALSISLSNLGGFFFEFEVKVSGQYFFSIHKNSKKFTKNFQIDSQDLRPQEKKDFFSSIGMLLAKRNFEDTFDLLCGKRLNSNCNWISMHCDIGRHLLYVRFNWLNFNKKG